MVKVTIITSGQNILTRSLHRRRRRSIPWTLQWAALSSLKIAPSRGRSGPHLLHGFFDPSEFTTQTVSRPVQRFSQGS